VVDVVLDSHLPGVDLDWCVWDPGLGAYTVCAESDLDPELGSFLVVPPGNEFHLVVSSFSGSSSYTLELHFSTYYGADASDALLADAAEPAVLPVPRDSEALEYGRDRTWDVPAPDHPIFSGPLFEFPEQL
jgi:hypothetical protein